MKTKIFAVYDTAVKAFMQPFFTQTVGLALRSFQEICNDSNTMVSKHPADFTLFELGSYDEETGKFENLNTPHSIATALSITARNALPPAPNPRDSEVASTVERVRKAVENHSERNIIQ